MGEIPASKDERSGDFPGTRRGYALAAILVLLVLAATFGYLDYAESQNAAACQQWEAAETSADIGRLPTEAPAPRFEESKAWSNAVDGARYGQDDSGFYVVNAERVTEYCKNLG